MELSLEQIRMVITAVQRIRGIAIAMIEGKRPMDPRLHRRTYQNYEEAWNTVTSVIGDLKMAGFRIEHPNPCNDLRQLYGYLKGSSSSWAGRRTIINEFYDPLEQQLKDILKKFEAGIEKELQNEGTKMSEEEKKGRFIHVTVDEPEQPLRRFTFFTDASSGSILAESTAQSGVYVAPAEYQRLLETLDGGRGKKVDGVLAEAILEKAGKTVRFIVAQTKTQIRIFICYAKEDISQAGQIYTRLKSEGYDPWIDKEKLVGGQDWELEIAKAIEESNFFLACVSNNSVNKEGYVQKELKKGMDVLDRQPEGRIYLIPVKFEDCQVPLKLHKWQWVDFFEPNGMERLLKAIESGCDQRACIA